MWGIVLEEGSRRSTVHKHDSVCGTVLEVRTLEAKARTLAVRSVCDHREFSAVNCSLTRSQKDAPIVIVRMLRRGVGPPSRLNRLCQNNTLGFVERTFTTNIYSYKNQKEELEIDVSIHTAGNRRKHHRSITSSSRFGLRVVFVRVPRREGFEARSIVDSRKCSRADHNECYTFHSECSLKCEFLIVSWGGESPRHTAPHRAAGSSANPDIVRPTHAMMVAVTSRRYQK